MKIRKIPWTTRTTRTEPVNPPLFLPSLLGPGWTTRTKKKELPNRAFTSYFAKKWRDAGFNAKEARKWSAAGYYELAEALAAKAAGHNVPEIEEVEMDIADFTAF